MSDHDDLISQFCELTAAPTEQAAEYLSSNDWELDSAVTAYFADQDEPAGEAAAPAAPEPEYTGPRTLDGRPAPQYASSSSAAAGKKPQKRTGLATLSSLGGGSSHGHGHDHDDDDEDEDDEDDERRGPRDLFAGGEKSGLAVQDPAQGSSHAKKLINDIVNKAKANSKRPENDASAPAGPSRSSFRGSGQTLGGDGVESRVIPDPLGEPIPRAGAGAGAGAGTGGATSSEVQERVLHLWTDGFSVDDGELKRFDDPQNSMDLQMIRQGRAPLHLMNVRLDQPVDVKLQQHNEAWHPLPKVYRPFGGEGRRLGSPVPGEGSGAATPPAAQPASSSSAAAAPGETQVDNSQPTLTLRIQMPDGTRLPARFNMTHTVGDIYDFVRRASAATQSRPWVLLTTFPNKEHIDETQVLGDMPEFKKGGTAVVKWV